MGRSRKLKGNGSSDLASTLNPFLPLENTEVIISLIGDLIGRIADGLTIGAFADFTRDRRLVYRGRRLDRSSSSF